MDIEKLIERLRTESLYADKASLEIMDLCMEAATALSTLHGENEKLRENLEQVKRERDAAVKTIFQWTGCPECKWWNSADEWCEKHDREADGYGGCESPEWRGPKEDDMERLTYFNGGEWRLKIGDTEYSGNAVDRLAAYEETGMEPEEVDQIKRAAAHMMFDDVSQFVRYTLNNFDELQKYKALGDYNRLRELAQADREGKCFIGPFVAMIEQSLSGGEMKPQRDQRFNGRYAVVYFDPKKWSSPLIDICGTPYNREEAEERMKVLKAALRREQDD